MPATDTKEDGIMTIAETLSSIVFDIKSRAKNRVFSSIVMALLVAHFDAIVKIIFLDKTSKVITIIATKGDITNKVTTSTTVVSSTVAESIIKIISDSFFNWNNLWIALVGIALWMFVMPFLNLGGSYLYGVCSNWLTIMDLDSQKEVEEAKRKQINIRNGVKQLEDMENLLNVEKSISRTRADEINKQAETIRELKAEVLKKTEQIEDQAKNISGMKETMGVLDGKYNDLLGTNTGLMHDLDAKNGENTIHKNDIEELNRKLDEITNEFDIVKNISSSYEMALISIASIVSNGNADKSTFERLKEKFNSNGLLVNGRRKKNDAIMIAASIHDFMDISGSSNRDIKKKPSELFDESMAIKYRKK